MGFFKSLAYVAGGVGAVVLAPVTGGSSLALAIGAMGTTTAAGAVIGASVGAAAAAIDHSSSGKKESYSQGKKEGTKAGEAVAAAKYNEKMSELTKRLKNYQDHDEKLLAMYAVGLATANSDGVICQEEREELDYFVGGILSGYHPPHIKELVEQLAKYPPSLERALEFARNAKLPKRDIDDIIDIIINADGIVEPGEKQFRAQWQAISANYAFT